MANQTGGKRRAQVWTFEDGRLRPRRDDLAVEEPLEIRLKASGQSRRVAVTMRTPGSDFELAAGFLFAEGVIAGREALDRIVYCVDEDQDGEQRFNIVSVELRATALPDLTGLERHFTIGSACGVCGRAGLDALRARGCAPLAGGPTLRPELIAALPGRLRDAQGLFGATGGLHAAALFDASGVLLAAREDVGRHNAVDKLVGWALLQGRLPLADVALLVSGRASYEIVQKALAAGIPIVCAVSAPSSLAVSLARSFGLTLVGFLRGERFNVYAGVERVTPPSPD
ncbi:MAG: formate dehydrogenase accessory sulfurtransferase FdhD [Chloroflexi bacterium OHK40]